MELFDFPTYKKNLTKLSNFHLKNCKYSRNMSQLPQKKMQRKKSFRNMNSANLVTVNKNIFASLLRQYPQFSAIKSCQLNYLKILSWG